MTTVEEGRKAAEEIAVMLKEMTASQKIKARDVLAGVMLVSVAKKEDRETS